MRVGGTNERDRVSEAERERDHKMKRQPQLTVKHSLRQSGITVCLKMLNLPLR